MKISDGGRGAERVRGLSHAQYLFNPAAPETKEVFEDIAAFFDKHLAQ